MTLKKSTRHNQQVEIFCVYAVTLKISEQKMGKKGNVWSFFKKIESDRSISSLIFRANYE